MSSRCERDVRSPTRGIWDADAIWLVVYAEADSRSRERCAGGASGRYVTGRVTWAGQVRVVAFAVIGGGSDTLMKRVVGLWFQRCVS